jgi:Co/Zn/Cd efflux system component
MARPIPSRSRSNEHAEGSASRDNNLRAAFLHVIGDAAVSVM